MKTISVYQCEICGTEYRNEEAAIVCELWGRPPQQFHIGQKVYFHDDDRNDQEDIVMQAEIGCLWGYLNYQTEPLLDMQRKYMKEKTSHQWRYKVQGSYHYGDTYTDVICESQLHLAPPTGKGK